jgi:hypothetical protein
MPAHPIRFHLAIFASAILLASASSARAELFRAYLASAGSDANACTLPAPCRLLPAALAATVDGGEVWLLDSANYNTSTVDVTKSVSILAVPGAVGSALAIGGPAIRILSDNLRVSLRNLVIAPLPASGAESGVYVGGASLVTIENSLIANLPVDGVVVLSGGKAKIANTTIRNNGSFGVLLENGAQAEISGTQMLSNAYGGVYANGYAASTTTANVSDSVISGGNVGVWARSEHADAVARITVTRSTIDGVLQGLQSETTGIGSALVTVSRSLITNSVNAWNQSGAGSLIYSLGDNHFSDNTSFVGSLTPMAPQ